MPFTIQTNVAALSAQRNLVKNQNALLQSLTRLSSGFRINSAADDAAGLSLSEHLRADVRSYAVVERNTQTALSLTTTAEGGAGEISSVLIRLRELAVQAANGDLNSTDREVLDTEYQELKSEVNRLAEATEFNDIELLAGSVNTIQFQVGIETTAFDKISVTFGGVGTTSLGINGTDLSGTNATGANAAITALDGAIDTLSKTRARFGAAINRFTFALSNDATIRENLESAESAIRDADIAVETSSLARHQVLVQAGTAVLATANQLPGIALSLFG